MTPLLRLRLYSFVATLIFVTALLVTACTWEDPFPEYAGVNLITDRGLDIDSFAAAHMDGSDPLVFEYVRVTIPGDYGSAAGLPSGAETTIRRLEAVNIFPDGDFEASTVGLVPNDWVLGSVIGPPATDAATFEVEATGVSSGQSLLFETAGTSAGVLDLDTFAPGFVSDGLYFLSYQFVRDSPTMVITLDYGDDATTTYLQNRRWIIDSRDDALTPVETVPTAGDPDLDIVTSFAASGTASNYFYAGSPVGVSSQRANLDNIRLGRYDQTGHVALGIALENSAGELPIVESEYEFSVWVKSEIDAEVTPAAGGLNRFRAGQIVLGINNEFELITQADSGWDTDTWTEVSATFILNPDDLVNDPPLVVRLAITHPDSLVIGSVLIANPVVELASRE